MTPEEIQQLRDNVATAERDASDAAAALVLNPNDPANVAADQAAKQRLADAKNALAAAEGSNVVTATRTFVRSEDTTPEIVENKGRITGLGIYLLFLVLASIYFLGCLMVAVTDQKAIDEILAERRCCKAEPTATPTATPAATPTATATATPVPTATATAIPNDSANTNENANVNANVNAKANNAKANANANANAKANTATNSNTNKASDDDNIGDNEAPDVNIPHRVYIRIPGTGIDGVWSADGYVFLVVFFSGMLGGSIRGIYSFVKHLGLRDFSFLWSWFYITLPFSGAALSIAIYFVIRGGFYGGSFGKGLVLNLFSFAALAALTGLFTDNAMEKLKSVAETLLAESPPKVGNAKEIQDKKEAEKKSK